MKQKKIRSLDEQPIKPRPASSPEARENQLIALAVDRAEQQLIDGTASPSVIVHYLKMGSIKEKIEREKLQKEKELLEAKVEALESTKRIEELYERAIGAMRSYGGSDESDED